MSLERKSYGFVGRLGDLMTVTLEDKCDAKVNYDWVNLNLTYS